MTTPPLPRLALFLAVLLAPALPALAEVRLPVLISDHMVLQKSARTALWGTAKPGEEVTATLGDGGPTGTAAAGPDGKWRIELDLSKSGPGPFILAIAGENKITLNDVAVGEVWVASGQSNMNFRLNRAIGAEDEISRSGNAQLRLFTVPNVASPTPLDECKGNWQVAGPVTSGSFTAVGYYFAKNLQQALHVPVGLLFSAWGDTPSESWTSVEALDTVPDLRDGSARLVQEAADRDAKQAAYLAAFHEWAGKNGREDKPADPVPFADPAAPTDGWKPVPLPGRLSADGLSDAGAVWIRRIVSLHGAAAKFSPALDLTDPNSFETVYYDGKKVGAVTPETYAGPGVPRRYFLSHSVDGDNVLAIRLYIPAGGAGLGGSLGKIPLKGEWLAKAEYALPPLDDAARRACPQAPAAVAPSQNRPATLYNGMIHPLLPYTIAGAVWYQGEKNAGRAFQYQTAFPLMIQDWRRRWGLGDFPFYWCQLANFQAKQPDPGDSAWAELREAQTKTLSLPNTDEVVLIDLGEAGDIHPRDKKDVGERLARVALAKTYGQPAAWSGPVFLSQQVEGDRIRLTFGELGGGLVARPLPETYVVSSTEGTTQPTPKDSPNSELQGFAICGDDRKWVWADARIDGGTVVVSSPAAPKPVAVRYAWADNPTANLYNKAGLPAGPFRTDAFPGITEEMKFGF